MAGQYTNGLNVFVAPGNVVDHLTGNERLPADTRLPNGENPASLAATAFNIAAVAAGIAFNTGTLTAGTATVNAKSGVVNTGSITTAAGSSTTFTLVNSQATVGAPVQLGLANGTNVTGQPIISSATIATAGTLSVTILNSGTAALAGSLLVPFQIGSSGV